MYVQLFLALNNTHVYVKQTIVLFLVLFSRWTKDNKTDDDDNDDDDDVDAYCNICGALNVKVSVVKSKHHMSN